MTQNNTTQLPYVNYLPNLPIKERFTFSDKVSTVKRVKYSKNSLMKAYNDINE